MIALIDICTVGDNLVLHYLRDTDYFRYTD